MQKSNNAEEFKNQNSKIQTLKSISKLQTQNSKLHSGITLIALVVTIVVLLILAGVTITLMFGENSIFDTAKDASIKAKLGELEDRLGVIYSNLVTQKYATNSNKEITTSDIVNKLEGYEIKEKQLAENAITGIEIAELENGKIMLIPDETKELTVNVTTSEGGYAYYAVIEGKNYEIKLENGKLKVNREPQEVEDGTPTTAELKIEILEGSTVTVNKKENEEKSIVVLQAGSIAGNTKIKLTYGSSKPLEFTAEVEIKPSADAEENIEGVTFKTDFGKIDIIWLEGTTNNPSSTQTPNSPANYLNGMKPVRWEGTTEDDTITATDPEWYSYNEATGTTDSKTSHWANAKTSNGSYFVWIPRYAYRITYYNKNPNTDSTAQITGYYDGYGMWRANDGALKCKLETDSNKKTIVETINYNGEKYIVHPAFTTNLDMGGWSENLPGFWFAKFEMSGSSSETLASVPGVASYRNAKIGTFYTVARNATYGMTGTTDTDGKNSFMYSHMVKNSEWGAVAYLTHSRYGRNGYEIKINDNSSFYTGGGSGATAYTEEKNQLQSTTGNNYGIYDMSGGAEENIASFNKKSTSLSNGSSFASKGKASTKYATAYENATETYNGSPTVYTVCKTGDGIKEVFVGRYSSTVSWYCGWFTDVSSFASSDLPFFGRSHDYSAGYTSGVFTSQRNLGGAENYRSFRVALCQ